MNYIKKKIKGKKNVTDDDDLDPDVFHVPQAPEGAPKDWVPYDERIDHDSEEWLAFKQLTQRVTNIVEESKQNLTKIVATTTLDENTRTIKEVVTTKPKLPDLNFKKKSSAPPPRPAPPAKPPPPASTPTPAIVSICPTKNFDEDKRFESFGSFDDSFEQFAFSRNTGTTKSAHFGFEPAVVADLPVPELVLDVDNLNLGLDIAPGEPDPFDTSFVDHVHDGPRNEDLFELEPEIQNLNVLLEETLEKFGIAADDDDDPFVIKEDVLAAVDSSSPHLTSQTRALPVATTPTESFIPQPDLCLIADDDHDFPTSGSSSNLDALPGCNPFAIAGCDSMSALSCDLFALGGPPLDRDHSPVTGGGDELVVSQTVSDRRASNPFCQSPPINETIAGGGPIDADLFVSTAATTTSSSLNTHFDPFDTTQLPLGAQQRQFSALLLTPQTDFASYLDLNEVSSTDFSPQSPSEPALSSDKPRPAPVRPPIPEFVKESERVWDCFDTSELPIPISNYNFDEEGISPDERVPSNVLSPDNVSINHVFSTREAVLDNTDLFGTSEEPVSRNFDDSEPDPFDSFSEKRSQNCSGNSESVFDNAFGIEEPVLEKSDPFGAFDEREERAANSFDDLDSDPFGSFTENRAFGSKEAVKNNVFGSDEAVRKDSDPFSSFNDTEESLQKSLNNMKSDSFNNFNHKLIQNQVFEPVVKDAFGDNEAVRKDSDPFGSVDDAVANGFDNLECDSFSNFNKDRIQNKVCGAKEPIVNTSFDWPVETDPFDEPVLSSTFNTLESNSSNKNIFENTESDPFDTLHKSISNDNLKNKDKELFSAINKAFGTEKSEENNAFNNKEIIENNLFNINEQVLSPKDQNPQPNFESNSLNTFYDSSETFMNSSFDPNDPFRNDAFGAKEAVQRSTFDSPGSDPFNAFDHRGSFPINDFSNAESVQNSKFSPESDAFGEEVLKNNYFDDADSILNSKFDSDTPIKSSAENHVLNDPFSTSEIIQSAVSKPNKFDILMDEDKVDFEPISVHLNITPPSPKIKSTASFEDNCGFEHEELPPTAPNDAPAPFDNEELVNNSIPLEDNFGFDAENDARIFATEPEDSKPIFIDTSAFEDFEAKFSSMLSGQSQSELEPAFNNNYDPFSDFSAEFEGDEVQGFGPNDDFDSFFGPTQLAPQPSPAHLDSTHASSPATFPQAPPPFDKDTPDSDDSGPDFSVFIRPKLRDENQSNGETQSMPVPMLAPPPAKSPTSQPRSPLVFQSYTRTTPVSNHIDLDDEIDEFLGLSQPKPIVPPDPNQKQEKIPHFSISGSQSRDELESLGSPVFEADDSVPLEDVFPAYDGHGWEMVLRTPNKKKLTGQRSWKKIYIVLKPNSVLHLFAKKDDKDPFQELPLQGCYSLSEIATQQYDQYGKIFTLKLQYVFYKERVGVRPGQISKVTHGQITSLSKLAKLGLPLEHAPQVSQLLKLGSQNYAELREFVRVMEDALFHLLVHRDRAVVYKTEEIQVTVVDELRAEVADSGTVLQQVARVRVFFLAFIADMPDVDIGLNDITKQGKEIVSRHDIIPVVTEEWIRLEKCEFHACVVKEAFEKNRTLRVHPPDACFFELMRFRIRPPKNRELPLQVRPKMTIIDNRVEIRAEVIVPGSISRKHGQIPCEDVAIRFPIPECWIYLFRTEKHFRYGSVKSTNRRAGKLKGLDRFMGTGSTLDHSLIEVSTGQAKYEHHHRAIVWRVPKLPKDGQGAYSTYLFTCRMDLGSHDQLPEQLESTVHVEFYMPTTTVSHTTVRSITVTNPNPPEKYVKYLAYHSYRVGIEHVKSTSENEYAAVTSGVGNGANGVRSDSTIREEEDDEAIPIN